MNDNIVDQIIQLRKEKVSYQEISKRLNLSIGKVRYHCNKNGLKGIVPTNRIKRVALEMFLDNLEKKFKGSIVYVSGYKDSDSSVSLKCDKCSHMFVRNAQVARNKKKTECPNCLKTKRKIEIKVIYTNSLTTLKEINLSSCEECEKPFVKVHKNAKYCTVKCKNKVINRKKEVRKRITKLNGKIDTTISIPRLIKKEKNVCYLCGGQCNEQDFTTDNKGSFIVGPNYPSIEHVIPISKGGTHTWDNVKLAHHYCNSIKSNKTIIEDTGQLVLMI